LLVQKIFHAKRVLESTYYDFFAGKNIIPEEVWYITFDPPKKNHSNCHIVLTGKTSASDYFHLTNISTGIEQAASIIGI
jgi:hypothetical protein